jgi:hypothetical protein
MVWRSLTRRYSSSIQGSSGSGCPPLHLVEPLRQPRGALGHLGVDGSRSS